MTLCVKWKPRPTGTWSFYIGSKYYICLAISRLRGETQPTLMDFSENYICSLSYYSLHFAWITWLHTNQLGISLSLLKQDLIIVLNLVSKISYRCAWLLILVLAIRWSKSANFFGSFFLSSSWSGRLSDVFVSREGPIFVIVRINCFL